jgi:hypothetical protein
MSNDQTTTQDQTLVDEQAFQETFNPKPAQPLTRMDDPIPKQDRARFGVSRGEGLRFETFREMMDFAMLMSQGGEDNVTVPAHCRGRPYVCLGICERAYRWDLDPYFCAEHSYVSEKKDGTKTLAFDASIFIAIINARAPIKERGLKFRYEGEGDDRVCIAYATFIGEASPTEHRSKPLKDARPAQRTGKDGGKYTPGSPLWQKKPDMQLSYDTGRDWGRKYVPQILAGIYDKDELDEYREAMREADKPTEATPNFMARLPGRIEGEGFHPDAVQNGTASPVKGRTRKSSKGKGDDQPASEAANAASGGAKEAETRPEPKTPDPAAVPGTQTQQTQQVPTTADAPSPESAATVGPQPGKIATFEGKTVEEYRAHLIAWLKDAKTVGMVSARYALEDDIRKTLKMIPKEKRVLQQIADDRIAELSS